jgi:RNA polymerase primary sigma factor
LTDPMKRGKKQLDGLETFAPCLDAARALGRLSAAEERAIAERARRGDMAARDELVRRNLPLVVMVARRQARGSVRLEELVQEGNLGLLRAIEKYDPGANTRFATYAVWWIRAFVWRYLKHARSAVRPKSGTTAREDLSLDRPFGDDEDVTFLDRLEDDAPSTDARYARLEDAAQLRDRLERARARIGELGWDIIHSRLKQDPPDTLEQIGKRWGLSRERVRQVETKTKQFLRGYLEPANEETLADEERLAA